MKSNTSSFSSLQPSLLVVVLLAILARLIPHVSNVSPFTALCVFLSAKYSYRVMFLTLLTSILVSNGLLSMMYGYPFIGSWFLFGIGAYALIGWGARFIEISKKTYTLLYVITSSLIFWLITNLGVWLAGYYPHNFNGLMECYIVAIPFLKLSVVGDLLWSAILFFLPRKQKTGAHYEPHYPH